jgi:hypothetical protein
MNIDNTSLTSLNQEFTEYENINKDFDFAVLDFWRKHEIKFSLLSQVDKKRFLKLYHKIISFINFLYISFFSVLNNL